MCPQLQGQPSHLLLQNKASVVPTSNLRKIRREKERTEKIFHRIHVFGFVHDIVNKCIVDHAHEGQFALYDREGEDGVESIIWNVDFGEIVGSVITVHIIIVHREGVLSNQLKV